MQRKAFAVIQLSHENNWYCKLAKRMNFIRERLMCNMVKQVRAYDGCLGIEWR